MLTNQHHMLILISIKINIGGHNIGTVNVNVYIMCTLFQFGHWHLEELAQTVWIFTMHG